MITLVVLCTPKSIIFSHDELSVFDISALSIFAFMVCIALTILIIADFDKDKFNP